MRCQCIICTDNFDGAVEIASVPCGHTFHVSCLERWLKSNPTCPTCRIRVKNRDIRKIYLTSLDDTITDAGRIENELSDARVRLHELQQKHLKVEEDLGNIKELFKGKEGELAKYKEKYYDAARIVKSFKAKERFIKDQLLENQQLHRIISELRDTIQKTNHMRTVLQGTADEVEDLLRIYGPGENSVQQIATFCVLMKRELTSVKSELKATRNQTINLNRQLKAANDELTLKDQLLLTANEDIAKFKSQCAKLRNQLEELYSNGNKVTSKKRSFDEVTSSPELKKNKLDSLLDISVVTTPPVNKPRTGYLAEKNVTNRDYATALPGYSKLRIVVNKNKEIVKTHNEAKDNSLLKIVMANTSIKQSDKDSKVRTGYNGLGGHSNYIQKLKKSTW